MGRLLGKLEKLVRAFESGGGGDAIVVLGDGANQEIRVPIGAACAELKQERGRGANQEIRVPLALAWVGARSIMMGDEKTAFFKALGGWAAGSCCSSCTSTASARDAGAGDLSASEIAGGGEGCAAV